MSTNAIANLKKFLEDYGEMYEVSEIEKHAILKRANESSPDQIRLGTGIVPIMGGRFDLANAFRRVRASEREQKVLATQVLGRYRRR